eukprot:TRINITY_DN374_c0_g1_i1.p1 TRINITY_DN374_c0_g1~~TRINITY_DN374_c0_g1_i1.p1  ORF type:complete len:1036 (+),score=292.00 TRINITY_DN374_c0_g1_i1:68-3175(+)
MNETVNYVIIRQFLRSYPKHPFSKYINDLSLNEEKFDTLIFENEDIPLLGFLALNEVLKHNDYLKNLILVNVGLNGSMLNRIKDGLMISLSKNLKEVWLKSNNLDDTCIDLIKEIFFNNSNIRYINISNNSFTNQSYIKLLKNLYKNRNLQVIDFSRNSIDTGIYEFTMDIIGKLDMDYALEWINLENNFIDNQHLNSIERLFLKRLTRLNLSKETPLLLSFLKYFEMKKHTFLEPQNEFVLTLNSLTVDEIYLSLQYIKKNKILKVSFNNQDFNYRLFYSLLKCFEANKGKSIDLCMLNCNLDDFCLSTIICLVQNGFIHFNSLQLKNNNFSKCLLEKLPSTILNDIEDFDLIQYSYKSMIKTFKTVSKELCLTFKSDSQFDSTFTPSIDHLKVVQGYLSVNEGNRLCKMMKDILELEHSAKISSLIVVDPKEEDLSVISSFLKVTTYCTGLCLVNCNCALDNLDISDEISQLALINYNFNKIGNFLIFLQSLETKKINFFWISFSARLLLKSSHLLRIYQHLHQYLLPNLKELWVFHANMDNQRNNHQIETVLKNFQSIVCFTPEKSFSNTHNLKEYYWSILTDIYLVLFENDHVTLFIKSLINLSYLKNSKKSKCLRLFSPNCVSIRVLSNYLEYQLKKDHELEEEQEVEERKENKNSFLACFSIEGLNSKDHLFFNLSMLQSSINMLVSTNNTQINTLFISNIDLSIYFPFGILNSNLEALILHNCQLFDENLKNFDMPNIEFLSLNENNLTIETVLLLLNGPFGQSYCKNSRMLSMRNNAICGTIEDLPLQTNVIFDLNGNFSKNSLIQENFVSGNFSNILKKIEFLNFNILNPNIELNSELTIFDILRLISSKPKNLKISTVMNRSTCSLLLGCVNELELENLDFNCSIDDDNLDGVLNFLKLLCKVSTISISSSNISWQNLFQVTQTIITRRDIRKIIFNGTNVSNFDWFSNLIFNDKKNSQRIMFVFKNEPNLTNSHSNVLLKLIRRNLICCKFLNVGMSNDILKNVIDIMKRKAVIQNLELKAEYI